MTYDKSLVSSDGSERRVLARKAVAFASWQRESPRAVYGWFSRSPNLIFILMN